MEKQSLSFWPEWQITELIGTGSFGKVYKAERSEYGNTHYCAIKMISVPKNEEEINQVISSGVDSKEIGSYYDGVIADLVNEINLMMNLKGTENIVSIEDYKIIKNPNGIGGVIFIRMELLEPFEYFAENNELTEDEIVTLGINICTALEHCKTLNIIHRDIKPDNIFVTKFGTYKLGDFGIARKLDKLSNGLSKKGTFNYVAPEVFNGKSYDLTVDMYSLGIVMYKLLNHGRLPFLPPYPQSITHKDTENSIAIRMGGLQNMPLPQDCSATLGKIVLRACAFNPMDRFATPTQMKNALIDYKNRRTSSVAGYGDNFTNPNATVEITHKPIPSNLQNSAYKAYAPQQKAAGKEESKGKGFTVFMVIVIIVLLAVATALAVMLINGSAKGTASGSSSYSVSSKINSSSQSSSSSQKSSSSSSKPQQPQTQAPATEAPTQKPTQKPTEAPTQKPTEAPTQKPTQAPTQAPTQSSSSQAPSSQPSSSQAPTI